MDVERIEDLCAATIEAAPNAIKHGNAGLTAIWASTSCPSPQTRSRSAQTPLA